MASNRFLTYGEKTFFVKKGALLHFNIAVRRIPPPPHAHKRWSMEGFVLAVKGKGCVVGATERGGTLLCPLLLLLCLVGTKAERLFTSCSSNPILPFSPFLPPPSRQTLTCVLSTPRKGFPKSRERKHYFPLIKSWSSFFWVIPSAGNVMKRPAPLGQMKSI